MAEYKRMKDKNGVSRYMEDGKFISVDALDENLRDALDRENPGTALDETGEPINSETDIDEGSGTENPPVNNPEQQDGEASKESDQSQSDEQADNQVAQTQVVAPSTQQSDPGMGFPRKSGKTVDIFDGKTPHTHVRNVNGIMVPLSEENYNTKTDAEIIEKLQKLKMI